jgi:hypothetical protein
MRDILLNVSGEAISFEQLGRSRQSRCSQKHSAACCAPNESAFCGQCMQRRYCLGRLTQRPVKFTFRLSDPILGAARGNYLHSLALPKSLSHHETLGRFVHRPPSSTQ